MRFGKLLVVAALLAAGPAAARFEIGYYDHAGTTRVAEMAAAGVTLLIAYLPATTDPKPLLDEAQRRGMGVALQVEPRLPPGSDDLGAVAALVTGSRRHPALRAWYAFDEPEQKLPARRVGEVVGLIRRLDPEHPVLTVHSVDPRAPAFAGFGDIVGMDYYPVTSQAPLSRSLDLVVGFSEQLLGWVKGRPRLTLFVVQAFSWKDVIACPACRFPAAAELRYLVYAPLVTGVDAIAFWARYRTPDAEWRDTVAPLVRELRALRPSLERNAAGQLARPAPTVRQAGVGAG